MDISPTTVEFLTLFQQQKIADKGKKKNDELFGIQNHLSNKLF